MTSPLRTPPAPSPADVNRGRDLRRTALVFYPLVMLGSGLLAFRDTAEPWVGVAGVCCLVLAVVVWIVFSPWGLTARRATKRDSSSRAG